MVINLLTKVSKFILKLFNINKVQRQQESAVRTSFMDTWNSMTPQELQEMFMNFLQPMNSVTDSGDSVTDLDIPLLGESDDEGDGWDHPYDPLCDEADGFD